MTTVNGEDWVSGIDPTNFAAVKPGETRQFNVTLTGIKQSSTRALTYPVELWIRARGSAILKRVQIPVVVPAG